MLMMYASHYFSFLGPQNASPISYGVLIRLEEDRRCRSISDLPTFHHQLKLLG
jgi:hypothetical protein